LNLVFLNSAFLLAATAAVLPLIIHLISRRRVEVVDFSSIRFLRELERKKIRRVRLRQILLLPVRPPGRRSGSRENIGRHRP
jgi:hypothetical protein